MDIAKILSQYINNVFSAHDVVAYAWNISNSSNDIYFITVKSRGGDILGNEPAVHVTINLRYDNTIAINFTSHLSDQNIPTGETISGMLEDIDLDKLKQICLHYKELLQIRLRYEESLRKETERVKAR